MALTITNGPTGLFSPVARDQFTALQMVLTAVNGSDKNISNRSKAAAAADAAERRKRNTTCANWIAGRPDFTAEGDTTDDTDEVIINLNDLGVTFPAGYIRTFRCKYLVRGNGATEVKNAVTVFTVIGGSTPVVLGTDEGTEVVDNESEAGLTGDPKLNVAQSSDEIVINVEPDGEAEALHWTVEVYIDPLMKAEAASA